MNKHNRTLTELFYDLLNSQKLSVKRSSVFSPQLKPMYYSSANRAASLNINILVNTKYCFRLTFILTTLSLLY
jgi:hypothetical protein